MSDPREAQLAQLVLELEAMRAERRELLKTMTESLRVLQERIQHLAQDIRSGQLQIDGGPVVTVVGVTNGRR